MFNDHERNAHHFQLTLASTIATPTNLVPYRNNVGEYFSFIVTGSASGSVWGTNIYTDDSAIATAVVHSGFVSAGATKYVTFYMLGPLTSFTGSTQNGVTSSSFGPWPGSYSIVNATD